MFRLQSLPYFACAVFAVAPSFGALVGHWGFDSVTNLGVDSAGGSGFSFADMAANRAGILFAGGLLNKRLTLASVSDEFTVANYMPAVDDLPEGLSAAELLAQFGPQTDDRFHVVAVGQLVGLLIRAARPIELLQRRV